MLAKIKVLFQKNKEIILYLIFGVGTTAVDFIVSYVLYPTKINIHVIHVIAWLAAVAFAYITNRLFVFESKAKGPAILGEVISFAGSRVMTLVLQGIIVWVLHDKMQVSEYVVKIPASVLVVILNYVLNKLIVFRKGGKNE